MTISMNFTVLSSHWFSIALGMISLTTVLSNIFFLFITLTSKSLRSKSSYWFLIGFSCSDLLHAASHVFDAVAIWLGSVDNRHLCTLAGTVALFTGTSSLGFPSLVAADRYYKITIPEFGKFSLGHALFSVSINQGKSAPTSFVDGMQIYELSLLVAM